MHMLLRRILPIFLLGLALMAGPARAGEVGAVVVLLGDRAPAYQEVADAVRAELDRYNGGTDPVVLQDLSAPSRLSPRVWITVGTNALQAVLEADARTPVIATLLPRPAFERVLEQSGRRGSRPVSAVFLDQPVGRQLDLLRAALPDKRRLGVVLGPESQALAGALSAAAAERGLRLAVSRAAGTEEIYPALQRLLAESDVLLAEPDPTIYNSATIQNILLTTYRTQVPLIGFSPAYIRAGALLALYSTPAQLGTQVGEMVRGALAGRSLPAPQWPREFTVSTNPHVARSLDLRLAEPAQIAEHMRLLERH